MGSTVLGRQVSEPFEAERWYAFNVYLEKPWPNGELNEVVAQWLASGDVFLAERGPRSPPLALRIAGCEWRFTYGSDEDLISQSGSKTEGSLTLGAIEPGTRADFRFHVRWSFEGSGFARVWINDNQVVDLSGHLSQTG